MRRFPVLTLAIGALVLAPFASAQHVQRKVVKGKSVARKLVKLEQLTWSKSLDDLRERSRKARKMMLWIHVVGDLDGGL